MKIISIIIALSLLDIALIFLLWHKDVIVDYVDEEQSEITDEEQQIANVNYINNLSNIKQ